MNIRSVCGVMAATLAMTASGCGDGSSAGPQTEQGAIDAVVAVQRGVLKGDAGALLDHLSADCRASVNEQDVKLMVGFARAMMSDANVDFDAIGVDASIDEFDGDTAAVSVVFDLPEGANDAGFNFSADTMNVTYEDGKWVLEDCDFADTSESDAEDLAAELEALGYAGTRESPVPAAVGAPIGGGFTVSIDDVLADASDYIESAGGYSSEPDPGSQTVLVRATIGYAGDSEPTSVGDVNFSIVGGTSAVGVDLYSCNSIPEELNQYGTSLMSGGVVSGAICGDVPTEDVDGMIVSVEQGYGGTAVFFDPTTPAPSPVPVVGATGPAEGADLSAARVAPIAVGTPTDVGEGWTATINGADLDATDAILAESDYNDPPASGTRFVLLDVSLTYNGADEPANAAFVDLSMVGNSNVTSASGSCQTSLEGQLDSYADVFIGGTIEGTLCFVVADADVDSLVVLATAGFGENPSVLAVK